jgi:four helix bundle protein
VVRQVIADLQFAIFDLRFEEGGSGVTEAEMKRRTKQFALRIINLIEAIPNTVPGRIIANQLGRAGTSVGANYRAACRARSRAEFLSKLGNVEEEADESCYWMELLMESALVPRQRVQPLWKESDEICAMTVASRRTTKGR